MVVPCTGQGEGHTAEPGVRQQLSSAAQCWLQIHHTDLLRLQVWCFWASGFRRGDNRRILSCSKTTISSFRRSWSVSYSLLRVFKKSACGHLRSVSGFCCACESNQLAKMVSQTPSATMSTGLCYFACAQQLLQPL